MKNLEKLIEETKSIEENQILSDCYIKELKVVPVDNAPILASNIKEKFGFSISEEELMENMKEGTGLALGFPTSNHFNVYPVSELAYGTIFERAGFGKSPTVLLKTKETSRSDAMCPDYKADILNKGVELQHGKCLVIERGKKVIAVHSDKYVYLSMTKILESLKNFLNNINYELVGSELTDEYLYLIVKFEDSKTKNKIDKAFLKLGQDTTDFDLGLVLLTSDVSLSSVCIYPVLLSGGKPIMILSEPFKQAHTGDASIEKVKEKIVACYAAYDNIETIINLFKSLKVKNAGCIFYMASRIGFPSELCLKYYEEFLYMYEDSNGMIQADGACLFSKLSELLDEYIKTTPNIEAVKQMQLGESIFRRIKYHLFEDDLPFVNSEI